MTCQGRKIYLRNSRLYLMTMNVSFLCTGDQWNQQLTQKGKWICTNHVLRTLSGMSSLWLWHIDYKHSAALKALQASENAHKHTSAELTRTRTAMQGVRATHQSELKKKEKEIERTLERWQKISDSQYKIAGTHSGLQCANVAAIEGQDIGRGHGFLDVALEQSEQARAQLEDEILYLKKLVVRTTNTIQTMLYQARCTILNNPNLDEVRSFIFF